MVDPVGPQGPPTRPAASACEAHTPQAARGRRIRLPYGLPGQPAAPYSAARQVVQFYAAHWTNFPPPLTGSAGLEGGGQVSHKEEPISIGQALGVFETNTA